MAALQEDFRLLPAQGTASTAIVVIAVAVAATLAGVFVWKAIRRRKVQPPANPPAAAENDVDAVAWIDRAYREARQPADFAPALAAMAQAARAALARCLGTDMSALTTRELREQLRGAPELEPVVGEFFAPADIARFGGGAMSRDGFDRLYAAVRGHAGRMRDVCRRRDDR